MASWLKGTPSHWYMSIRIGLDPYTQKSWKCAPPPHPNPHDTVSSGPWNSTVCVCISQRSYESMINRFFFTSTRIDMVCRCVYSAQLLPLLLTNPVTSGNYFGRTQFSHLLNENNNNRVYYKRLVRIKWENICQRLRVLKIYTVFVIFSPLSRFIKVEINCIPLPTHF